MDKFEEAFEFYVTTDPENDDASVQMLSFEGTLAPGATSETYYVVIIMKEDAGNEFQDKLFNGIGIQVNATNSTTNGKTGD